MVEEYLLNTFEARDLTCSTTEKVENIIFMPNPCEKVIDILVSILRVKVDFLCFYALSDATEWHGLRTAGPQRLDSPLHPQVVPGTRRYIWGLGVWRVEACLA